MTSPVGQRRPAGASTQLRLVSQVARLYHGRHLRQRVLVNLVARSYFGGLRQLRMLRLRLRRDVAEVGFHQLLRLRRVDVA